MSEPAVLDPFRRIWRYRIRAKNNPVKVWMIKHKPNKDLSDIVVKLSYVFDVQMQNA